MVLFITMLAISVLVFIVSIILGFKTYKRKRNKKIISINIERKNENRLMLMSVIGLIFSVFVMIYTLLNSVPAPTIYPLNNEAREYDEIAEVIIDLYPFLTTYYSLDGSDPKDGYIYEDAFSITKTTTVSAKNKFLLWWSEPSQNTYRFKENKLIENPNEPKSETFVPDYESGKENIISDATYHNNQGYFSKQDQMYYFATSTGIYKMNTNFEECKLIIDDQNVNSLNVLGDWIYYSGSNGICKIRTDGSNKKIIIDLEDYTTSMTVQNNMIYYIKSSDFKLYSNDLDGQNEKCLFEKTVLKFICADLYIYFIEATITKDNYGISYNATSLNKMFYNGDNMQIIFSNQYSKDGTLISNVPCDLCEYKDYIVCTNNFSLFFINKINNNIKSINYEGGYGLCVFDGYAYYGMTKPNINGFLTKVSLDSFEMELILKPFNDNVQLHCIYPVEDKILLKIDYDIWYYLDDSNELNRINFYTE